jgi:hypothetical protein
LNEARERGWELHTFCDATEDTWPSAVFKWVGLGLGLGDHYKLPFALDDDEEEEN